MNIYKAKLEIELEIEAFDENDAMEYLSDIFSIDDEIKNIKTLSLKRLDT